MSIVNYNNMEIEEINNSDKLGNIGIVKTIIGELDLYLLFFNGDKDIPLIDKGKVIFFSRKKLLERIGSYKLSIEKNNLEDEINLTINIEKVIKLIKLNNIDTEAVLINWINTVLDIIAAIELELPKGYKNTLYLFAEHLTFNRRYGVFLKQNQISRGYLTDIIYWINGAIFSNSYFEQ